MQSSTHLARGNCLFLDALKFIALTTLFSSAFFHKVDVTKWDEQVALFTAAKTLVSRIDYVFVNAGVSFDGLLLHPDNQPAEFVPPTLTVLDINLYGMVYSTNLAVQLLRAQEIVDGFRGKIVVTASLAYVGFATSILIYELTPIQWLARCPVHAALLCLQVRHGRPRPLSRFAIVC